MDFGSFWCRFSSMHCLQTGCVWCLKYWVRAFQYWMESSCRGSTTMPCSRGQKLSMWLVGSIPHINIISQGEFYLWWDETTQNKWVCNSFATRTVVGNSRRLTVRSAVSLNFITSDQLWMTVAPLFILSSCVGTVAFGTVRKHAKRQTGTHVLTNCIVFKDILLNDRQCLRFLDGVSQLQHSS